MGVWQSGRLGEASLTYSDVTCGVTDFLKKRKTTKNAQSPFCRSPRGFQPIKAEITSEVMVD